MKQCLFLPKEAWEITYRNIDDNEWRYIALFVFSEPIKKLFSIDCVNIFLFSAFFSIDFAQWKSVGLTHIAYLIE